MKQKQCSPILPPPFSSPSFSPPPLSPFPSHPHPSHHRPSRPHRGPWPAAKASRAAVSLGVSAIRHVIRRVIESPCLSPTACRRTSCHPALCCLTHRTRSLAWAGSTSLPTSSAPVSLRPPSGTVSSPATTALDNASPGSA